jgi:hypothetical protein
MGEHDRDLALLEVLDAEDLSSLHEVVDEIIGDLGPSFAGDLDMIAELFDERGESYPVNERLVAHQIAALLRQRLRIPLNA